MQRRSLLRGDEGIYTHPHIQKYDVVDIIESSESWGSWEGGGALVDVFTCVGFHREVIYHMSGTRAEGGHDKGPLQRKRKDYSVPCSEGKLEGSL